MLFRCSVYNWFVQTLSGDTWNVNLMTFPTSNVNLMTFPVSLVDLRTVTSMAFIFSTHALFVASPQVKLLFLNVEFLTKVEASATSATVWSLMSMNANNFLGIGTCSNLTGFVDVRKFTILIKSLCQQFGAGPAGTYMQPKARLLTIGCLNVQVQPRQPSNW